MVTHETQQTRSDESDASRNYRNIPHIHSIVLTVVSVLTMFVVNFNGTLLAAAQQTLFDIPEWARTCIGVVATVTGIVSVNWIRPSRF